MKNFFDALAIMFVLAACSSSFASTASSTISFTGSDTVVSGGINFPATYGSQTVLTSGTGAFYGFNAGHNTTFSDFSFSSPALATGGELLFEELSNDGLEGFQFKATSYAAANNGYNFGGVFLLYTCKGTANSCVLAGTDGGTASLNFTNSSQTAFTLTASAAPEPSSLILLGTGLLGAAGLTFRKRRELAIA